MVAVPSPLEYELMYARLGIPTIALEPLSKVPHRQYYGQFVGFDRIATADSVELRGRRASIPAANIGIPTGLVSGLLVIDGDTKRGGDPLRSLMEWSDMSGVEIPDDGPMVRTPSGGWHLYFRLSEPCGSPVGWLPSVDIRADGGQVAAPPSGVGTMKTWKSYVLMRGSFANIPDAPSELIRDVNSNGGRYVHSGEVIDGVNFGGRTKSQLESDEYFLLFGFGGHDGSLERNNTCHQVMSRWFSKNGPHRDIAGYAIAYRMWEATHQNTPFSWDEAKRAVRSAQEFIMREYAPYIDAARVRLAKGGRP